MRAILCLLGLLQFNFPAFANCEAGSYAIHTVATYKNPDATNAFLLFEKSRNAVFLSWTTEDLPLGESVRGLQKNWTFKYGSKTCGGVTLDVPKTSDEEVATKAYNISAMAKGCGQLLAEGPHTGYAQLNFKTKTITLPVRMDILVTAVDAAEQKRLQQFLDTDLKTRKLYWMTDLEGKGGAEIGYSSIVKTRFEKFTIGKGKNQFHMINAILKLKGIHQLFPSEQKDAWTLEMQKDLKLTSGFVDFPLIYFQREGKAATFLGDGSQCSYKRFVRYPKPQDESEGTLDRFRITNAFDLNHDGQVDILEINSRFTYWLKDPAAPQVIQQGFGC